VKKRPYLLDNFSIGARITATLLDESAPPTGLCLDASVVLSTRWNTLPPNEQEVFPAVAPNFVAEIRSMSDSKSFVHDKMCTWIDAGEGFSLDPITQNARIYSKGNYYIHWRDLGNSPTRSTRNSLK
ncbi:11213_t:CDS:2, partial [Paraglomus occultum]